MKFKRYRIADLLDEISMGPFGSNIKKECFVKTGVPVLNGSNLTGIALNDDEFRYVTEEKADSLGKANAHRSDVVVTHRGTLGQISFIPETSKYERYVISQSQFRFRCNEKVLPEYLTYYFHTRKGQYDLLSNASQVGVPVLARATTTFQQLEVEIPDIVEQHKIVEIFENFRKKMEINIKINNNLEQQAQAIYQQMFIENQNPNWKEGKLSDLVAVKYGKDHKKLDGGCYPVYGSGGIMRYVEKPLYTGESVLIPRKGTLNNVMYVNGAFWSVDTMFYTEMLRPNIAKFMYHFVKGKDLASLNAGSAVPSMTTNILNAMPLYVHDDETLSIFEETVTPMYSQMQENEKQSANLANIRDTLLPRLMSGELEVSDIDL